MDLRFGRRHAEQRAAGQRVPGWEGSTGPFRAQYAEPHVYARDVFSGAGNCVCGHPVGDDRHVQAAPGVPVPEALRLRSVGVTDGA